VTVIDLVRTILDVAGKQLEPDIRNQDAPFEREQLDNSKARKLLGWTPRHDLRAGLKKTLDWFSKQSHA